MLPDLGRRAGINHQHLRSICGAHQPGSGILFRGGFGLLDGLPDGFLRTVFLCGEDAVQIWRQKDIVGVRRTVCAVNLGDGARHHPKRPLFHGCLSGTGRDPAADVLHTGDPGSLVCGKEGIFHRTFLCLRRSDGNGDESGILRAE